MGWNDGREWHVFFGAFLHAGPAPASDNRIAGPVGQGNPAHDGEVRRFDSGAMHECRILTVPALNKNGAVGVPTGLRRNESPVRRTHGSCDHDAQPCGRWCNGQHATPVGGDPGSNPVASARESAF